MLFISPTSVEVWFGAAFTQGYKSKFTFFRRTIESFGVDPLQEAIDDLLLQTLFGHTEPFRSNLRQLVTLTPIQGALSLPDLRSAAPQQFVTSTAMRVSHVYSFLNNRVFLSRSYRLIVDPRTFNVLKTNILN